MTSMIRQTLDDISVRDSGTYCKVHCNVDDIKTCPASVVFKGLMQFSSALEEIIRLGSKQNVSMFLTMTGMAKLRI